MPHLSPLKWFFFSALFTSTLLTHLSLLWWHNTPSFTPFSHFTPSLPPTWHWS